jgi:hypothetical protein
VLAQEIGARLLRLDCFAGDDGKLVRYYEGTAVRRATPSPSYDRAVMVRVTTRAPRRSHQPAEGACDRNLNARLRLRAVAVANPAAFSRRAIVFGSTG